MKLLYPQTHFACYNYEKGQNAQFEIMRHPAGFVFHRNLHDTELVFALEGRFKLSYGKLVGEEIPAGKIMLFPPGSGVRVEVMEPIYLVICRIRDVVRLCECMSLERLYNENEPAGDEFYMLDINERTAAFIEQMVGCVNDGLRCTYYFATKMKELFFLLRAYYDKGQLTRFLKPMLGVDAQFMDLMYRNYRNVSSVNELAQLSNYSLSGFKKRFQRVFGTSASEWLDNQKGALVFQDLHNSPHSIKEIAEMHGFSSVAAFTTFCGRKFGMPPAKFRLNMESKDPEKSKSSR